MYMRTRSFATTSNCCPLCAVITATTTITAVVATIVTINAFAFTTKMPQARSWSWVRTAAHTDLSNAFAQALHTHGRKQPTRLMTRRLGGRRGGPCPPPSGNPQSPPLQGRGPYGGGRAKKVARSGRYPILQGAPCQRHHQCLMRRSHLGTSLHKPWLTRGAPTYAP